MFNSGVFSPFLGLCTNAQALNFHAVPISPRPRGDGACPACRASRGCRLPALLRPGQLGLGCWS